MKKMAVAGFVVAVSIGTTAYGTNSNSFNYSFATEEISDSSNEMPGIQLQNGKLYVNEELIHEGFSVIQGDFAFLYFYIPEKGLFMISNSEFEGGVKSGSFDKKKLSFDIDGFSIVLKSSSAILGNGEEAAWVKLDPNFELDAKAVVVGYGADTKAPYKWKSQMKPGGDN